MFSIILQHNHSKALKQFGHDVSYTSLTKWTIVNRTKHQTSIGTLENRMFASRAMKYVKA